jgi:hypothetical protein
MANIQKEISQLEHWLNNLSDSDDTKPTDNLTSVIDKLSEQVNVQQQTMNNILYRLGLLEAEKLFDTSPWLDTNAVPLQNEIVSDDIESEPLYTFNKMGDSDKQSVSTPSIIPDIPEDKSVVPDIASVVSVSDNTSVKEVVKEKCVELPLKPLDKKQEVLEKQEEEEVEEEEEEEEVEEEVEEVEEEVEEEEKQEEEEEKQEEEEEEEEEEEQEEEEEEEQEEEEEEGLELEEIEYNGTKYYRDSEMFIYSIDKDDQPSENPVGYWKEKTKSIAFYKVK